MIHFQWKTGMAVKGPALSPKGISKTESAKSYILLCEGEKKFKKKQKRQMRRAPSLEPQKRQEPQCKKIAQPGLRFFKSARRKIRLFYWTLKIEQLLVAFLLGKK